MTVKKRVFGRMMKQARQSAKDKAMALAETVGKPTSTGVATGVGLGAIMAAIGALNKGDSAQGDAGISGNPLLLGTLGAAGGYLAGNALERMPARRRKREMSLPALAALLGGGRLMASQLVKGDAEDALPGLKDRLAQAAKGIPTELTADGKTVYYPGMTRQSAGGRKGRRGRGSSKLVPIKVDSMDPASRKALEENLSAFNEAKGNYARALRMAGREEEAIRAGVYSIPDPKNTRLMSRIKDWWRTSTYSPGNQLKALDPRKMKLSRLKKLFTRPSTRTLSGLAALALLAGGGKAVYDYARD